MTIHDSHGHAVSGATPLRSTTTNTPATNCAASSATRSAARNRRWATAPR